MDRFIAHEQRVADRQLASSRDWNVLSRQIAVQLLGGPVSGPDDIPVVICYEESGTHWLRGLLPENQWPARNDSLLALFTWPALLVNLVVFRGGYSVYAHTLSGPTTKVMRRLPTRAAAASDAVALARQVRTAGVAALRQYHLSRTTPQPSGPLDAT